MSKFKNIFPYSVFCLMLILTSWATYSCIKEDVEMNNLKKQKLELEIKNRNYQLEILKLKNKIYVKRD